MNKRWMRKAFLKHRDFCSSTYLLPHIQKSILQKIIHNNKNTSFGKKHLFGNTHSVASFQKNVEVGNYNTFEPYVNEILEGKKNILTAQKTLLLEPTSGSTGGTKLIPYTQGLKEEFRNAIEVWLWDIFANMPDALKGKHYWSVSPVLQSHRKYKGNIKIGFDSDLEYLGWTEKDASKYFFVPPQIATITNTSNFWFLTALFLLLEKNLSFISVWSPTFLLQITQAIKQNKELLIQSLKCGKIYFPYSKNDFFDSSFILNNAQRSSELIDLLNNHINYKDIWNNLQLISCWADAGAKPYFDELNSHFKFTTLQAKGLLLTEGIISIPMFGFGGCVPAYTSHFYEFEDSNGCYFLLYQLKEGETYTVIITTSGGLYRYNTADKIIVTAFCKKLPLITFIGRAQTSDLTGEKLCEDFVNQSISKIKTPNKFIMLAPCQIDEQPHYQLFIEPKATIKQTEIQQQVERLLSQNYHYNYSRKNGQLAAVEIITVNNAYEKYSNHLQQQGIKLGDIKAVLFHSSRRWKELLCKQTIAPLPD